MSRFLYPSKFYSLRDRQTRYTCSAVYPILFKHLRASDITSVVDIGCGTATWLSAIREFNPSCSLHGFEGPWLPRKNQEQILEAGIKLTISNFSDSSLYPSIVSADLCICLEVLEHIPIDLHPAFIERFLSGSSNILFSCAPPYQGGSGHVGERSLSNLLPIFRDLGYSVCDLFRDKIWTDNQIPFWYRQNLVLFSRVIPDYLPLPLDIIHPDLLYLRANPSFSQAVYHLTNKLKPNSTK